MSLMLSAQAKRREPTLGLAPFHFASDSQYRGDKCKELSQSAQRRMINVALMPPNPNELDKATSKL
jgi:hypothetical protein